MSTKQEQRLHVHERERVGGQRSALSDTWSATLAQPKPAGRGTGRLRLYKRSASEHALRALGGGAA